MSALKMTLMRDFILKNQMGHPLPNAGLSPYIVKFIEVFLDLFKISEMMKIPPHPLGSDSTLIHFMFR